MKNAERLDELKGWPVSIAYFELGGGQQDAVPVYELSFLMFENGVSRKLYIDYGEFALQGELTSITFHEPSKCEQSRGYGRPHSHAAPRTPLASPQRGGVTAISSAVGEHVLGDAPWQLRW